MGNESSLNECPTEDAPSNCSDVCVRVNCLPANTSPVVQAHSSTQIASETRQAVKPSLTSSQRAITASLKSLQPLPNTLSVIETPQTLRSIRKRTTSVTGPQIKSSTEKESDSVFYNLNKLTITLIGVVTMVMVVAGTAVSVCLIVKKGRRHHIPKSGSWSIVTGDNMAYMEPKQSMRVYMEKNPAYSDLPPVEPIYENLEE